MFLFFLSYCFRAQRGTLLYYLLWRVFTISPLNRFLSGCGRPSRPPFGLSAVQPPPLTCVGCATSHYQTKSFILFTCSPWNSHLNKSGHFLSLSLMACTYWFQLIFPSFGWYVILTGHFPQKSLNKNPKIGFHLLPTARPYPLLPLTHGPPLLYWRGTSWWCLSLVYAPLPCVSIACLLLIRLPWLESSSMHSTTHSWPLMA